MADKQNPNDPQYDWLYQSGSSDSDAERTRQIHRPSDPREPTPPPESGPAGATADQAAPDQNAPDQAAPDQDEPGNPTPDGFTTDRPEHTAVLDFPPHDAAATSGAHAAIDPSPGPVPPPSFGGTYPAPVRQPAHQGPARYAAPLPQPEADPYGGGYITGPPSAPSPAGRPPSKRRNTRKWWTRGIIAVVVLWLVFLIVVPIWAWKNIAKIDADPGGDRPSDTPGTTYLLVGSDRREDLTKEERQEYGTGNVAGARTDTIILLHVPDSGGPRLLLSIPRDSYVDIPGHGKNKINAAYAFGGPKLLVQTVEQATDLRVDKYIEVGFAGFVDVVDAVGGITICPEQAINDPKAGHLKLKKGCQEVDGITALGYSRSRYGFALGDITRAQHQREVITAVGKKAASWQTVVFPWRYVKVNMAAADSLRVGEDVGPTDLIGFAWAMSHTGGKDAKRCVVPYSSLGASIGGQSVVLWDDAAAKAVFDSIRDDDTSSITCTATGQ
jgi:LCP family protein required for cell wall assembly